jgi:hypothetical protein
MQKLDEKTEREFRFQFKQRDLWCLHDLFLVMKESNSRLEMENSYGIKWTPDDGEAKLVAQFSKPNVQYRVRLKGSDRDILLYRGIFRKYYGLIELI